MKFLQTGDIHLGTQNSKLSAQKARQMRDEQLSRVQDFFDYAVQNDCEAIFITGDLFHTKNPSLKLVKVFFDMVEKSGIKTFYVRGNHDEEFDYSDMTPDNFILFGNDLQTYSFDEYTVSGAGTKNKKPPIYADDRTHFMLLHGDIFNPKSNDGIDLGVYQNRGIDYLALGHIHSFMEGKIDDYGKYVYSGSLFGNGFDECGEKGFVEIEVEGKNLSYSFKKFATRQFEIVEVDITDAIKHAQIKQKINSSLAKISSRDLVRVVLRGYFTEETEKYISLLQQEIGGNFFYFEIKDESKFKIDFELIKKESLSFKAEFLKLIEEDESLSDEEKSLIAQCGIEALRGDEISL